MTRSMIVGAAMLVTAGPLEAQPNARDTASTKSAQPDTAPKLSFGGFVDAYYAWDFRQPSNFDRTYTTQPARHAEFNVNLAFLETKLTGARYRGRLALQWGTSVQANYAGEPRLGGISGPSVSQFLQEASVGYQLGETLWLDGGIFFAHIGYEGWISRDNPTYTRSLIADFSPYYEAGIKLTWAPSSSVTTTLVLVNGWQNISNYNTPPATGIRIDYAASPKLTLTYDNFFGNAAPDTARVKLRFFNEVIAQLKPSASWLFAAALDVGAQSKSTPSGGTASWYGASVIGKYQLTDRVSMVGRVERYADPDQVIVITGLDAPFKTSGASLGLDVAFTPKVVWRTEARGFSSSDQVWPTHRAGKYVKNDGFLVTSMALTF